jgi:hypothetical protein
MPDTRYWMLDAGASYFFRHSSISEHPLSSIQ